VCGTIKWRLNNKSAKIRQQAADLIARIAPVMKACDEEQLLGHLGACDDSVCDSCLMRLVCGLRMCAGDTERMSALCA